MPPHYSAHRAGFPGFLARPRGETGGGAFFYTDNLPQPTPALQPSDAMKPRVEIEYCSQCRFILRAAWLAQELLFTFADEVGEVALKPGSGGIFEVRVDGAIVWSKKQAGRFPDSKELKQLVRDRIAPQKDLGHSDKKAEGR